MMYFSGRLMVIFIALNIAQCLSPDIVPGNNKEKESTVYTKHLKGQNVVLLIKNRNTTKDASITEKYLMISVTLPSPPLHIDAWINHILHHLIPERRMKRHATAEKKELPNHDKTIDYSNINLDDIILVIYNQDYRDPNSKKANLYKIEKENGKYSLKLHEQENFESLLKINIHKNPQTHKKNISKGDHSYSNKTAKENESIAQCPPNCVSISHQTVRNNSNSEVKGQYTKTKENHTRDNIYDSKFVESFAKQDINSEETQITFPTNIEVESITNDTQNNVEPLHFEHEEVVTSKTIFTASYHELISVPEASGYDHKKNNNAENVENHGQNHKEMFLQNVSQNNSKSVADGINESYVESICFNDDQKKDEEKKVESSSQNYKTTHLQKVAKKDLESVVIDINSQNYVESVFSNDKQKNNKVGKVERHGQYHNNTLLENNAQEDSESVAVSIHAQSYVESIFLDDPQKNEILGKVENYGQYHKNTLSVKNDQKDSESMDVEIHAQSSVKSAHSGNFDVRQIQEPEDYETIYFSENGIQNNKTNYTSSIFPNSERRDRADMYEAESEIAIQQVSESVAETNDFQSVNEAKMYHYDISSDKEYLQRYSAESEPPCLEASEQLNSITTEFPRGDLRDNKSETYESQIQIYPDVSFLQNNVQQDTESISVENDTQNVDETKMHDDISSDKEYLQRYFNESEPPCLEAYEQPISTTTEFSRDDLRENKSETYESQIQIYEDVSFLQNNIQQDTESVSEKNVSQNVDETEMHYDISSHKEYLQKYSADPKPPYLKTHNQTISISTEFSKDNLRDNNSNMYDSTMQIYANASFLQSDIKHVSDSQSIDETTVHYDISSDKEYLQKYFTYPEPPYLEEYDQPIPVTTEFSRSNLMDNKFKLYTSTIQIYENESFLQSNTQKDTESVTEENDSQSADETKVHYDISCDKVYLQEHSTDPKSSYLDVGDQSDFITTDFPRDNLKGNKPAFHDSESQTQQKSTIFQAAAIVESETELKNVSTTVQTVIQQESPRRNMLAFQPTSKPLTCYNMLKNITVQTGVTTEIPQNVQRKFQSSDQLSVDSGIGLDLKNNLKVAIFSKNDDIKNRSVSEAPGMFQTSVKNINSTNLLYTWIQKSAKFISKNATHKMNNLQDHLNATSIFLSRAENTGGYPLLEQSSQNNSKMFLMNYSRNEDNEAKFLVPANDRREIVESSVQSSNQRVTEENSSGNASQTNSKSSLSLNHQIQNKSAERLHENYSHYHQNSKFLNYSLNNKLNSNQINDKQNSNKDAHSQLDLNKHPDLLRRESQSAHNFTYAPYVLFPYNKSETNQKIFPFHMHSNSLHAAHIKDEHHTIASNISIENTPYKFIYGMSLKYPAQFQNDSHLTNTTDNSHILQNRTSIAESDAAKSYSHLGYKQINNTVEKKYGHIFRNNLLGLVASKVYQSNKGPTSEDNSSLEFKKTDKKINSEILTHENPKDSNENNQWYTTTPLNVLPMYKYSTIPFENKKLKWKGVLKGLKHSGTDAEINSTSEVLSAESNPSFEVLSKKPTLFFRNLKKTGLNSNSESDDKSRDE